MIAIVRLWRESLIGLLAIALGVAWLSRGVTEQRAAMLRTQLAATQLQLEHERESVRHATALARALDAANAARAERDQAEVSQEVNNAYLTELADLRRRYDALRMRSGATRGDPGGGGSTPVRRFSDAASRVDDAAPKAGLPPADRPGLPQPDALIASEQALRLRALQEWVRVQSQVTR